MTRNLDKLIADLRYDAQDWSGDSHIKRDLEDAAGMLAALRAQQEPNEPLTLEELRGMDGDKIYIQYIGTCKGFCDDEISPYYGQHEQYIQQYNGMLRACDLPLMYYGKAWLAYRHKQEEGKK